MTKNTKTTGYLICQGGSYYDIQHDGKILRVHSKPKNVTMVYRRETAERLAQSLAEHILTYPTDGGRKAASEVRIVPITGGFTHWMPNLTGINAAIQADKRATEKAREIMGDYRKKTFRMTLNSLMLGV